MDFVAVVDGERIQLFFDIVGIAVGRKVEGQHAALFMGFETLNLNMPKRGGGQDSTGELQHFCKTFFVVQFINGRPANHSVNGDLGSEGRNQERVAVLEAAQIGTYAMKEQVVSVHFFNKLFPAKVFERTQRTARSNAPCSKESIQGRGEGTNVVGAGLRDVANHVDAHCSQFRNGNVRGNVPELGAQGVLNRLLDVAQVAPADEQRAGLWQRDAPLSIDYAEHALRNASPNIDFQAIPGSYDVIGTHGKIHWESSGIIGGVAKHIQAKALRRLLAYRRLNIHIVEGRNISVRIGAVGHFYGSEIFLGGSGPISSGRVQLPRVVRLPRSFIRRRAFVIHRRQVLRKRQSIDGAWALRWRQVEWTCITRQWVGRQLVAWGGNRIVPQVRNLRQTVGLQDAGGLLLLQLLGHSLRICLRGSRVRRSTGALPPPCGQGLRTIFVAARVASVRLFDVLTAPLRSN